jgi:hypothetical protein
MHHITAKNKVNEKYFLNYFYKPIRMVTRGTVISRIYLHTESLNELMLI